MNNISRMGALEAGAAIAAGKLSSEDLVKALIDRIGQRENTVGAFAHFDAEHALAQARARDAEAPRGPLHGVPGVVKDVIDTFDMPTAYGSPIYEGVRPAADAACVALMRAAGMVVLGKSVTTEFALRKPGKTRNPHNTNFTPGGSSSGSAVAVADYLAPLGIGTQTGGSVIRPASYCGVVGYKPTWGTIPRMGLKMISESLDTIGVMARTVADASAYVDVLSGWPVAAVAPRETPPRLGFCRSPAWPQAEPASIEAMDKAVALLKAAGAWVEEVDLPEPWDDILDAQITVQSHESRRALRFEVDNHWDAISDMLRDTFEKWPAEDRGAYRAAKDVQVRARAALDGVFAKFDALVTPAAPGEPPRDLTTTGSPVFNRPWTLAGVPCVTVPGMTGPQGLPVGVQVVGAFGRDAELMPVADWVHRQVRGGGR